MSRFIRLLLPLSLILLLAACAGATEEPPPAEEPVAEVTEEPAPEPTEEATTEPTEEPTEEAVAATEEPTQEPTEEPVPESMVRTFQIVSDQSQASYAVEEEFFNREIDFFTAVGVTNQFDGQFAVEFLPDNQINLQGGEFTVDLSTLATDSPRRDQAIRNDWLESATYPLATFVTSEVQNFPEGYTEGEDVTFTVVGDMTIREVTQPVTFDITARLMDQTLSGSGSSLLFMRDFGFEPPSIFGVLEVTDGVTVTVDFVAEELQG